MIRRAEIANPNHLYTKTVTTNYTVTDRDELVLVDATAAAVTITLPDAVAEKNLTIYIKKVDSSGNAVTVATSLSQTIDGASTVSLSSQYATLAVVADGANWQIKTVSASGTFTGGTITGATAISVANANALAVGANGATNPVLQVDTSVASVATGVKIVGAASGGNVVIQAITSGTNENLILRSAGVGAVSLQPGTDSTTGIVMRKAANGTVFFRADSTNLRVRIGDGNAPSSALDVGGDVTVSAHNIITDTTTGMKIGTATTQKLGFFNSTPIVQPATTGTTTGFVASTGTTVVSGSTFTGNTGTAAYTIGDIVNALKLLGLMAA